MVSLAIWIAAALFLAYVGLVALAIFVNLLSGIARSIGSIRLGQIRPKFVRTKHDKVVVMCIALAAMIMVAIVIYSTTL